MDEVSGHRRVNDGLLAPLERPALRWLAGLVAPRISADGCTVIGLAGAVLCFGAYAASARVPWLLGVACLGVLVHWLGDSLDGTVARLRGEERPRYGFFADHVADTVCMVLIFLGVGLTPYVAFTVACLSLVAYQALAILVFLRTYVVGEFRLSFGKLGPTESQALLILLTVVMPVVGPAPLGAGLSAYDVAVGGFGLLATFHFIRTGWMEIRRLRAVAA